MNPLRSREAPTKPKPSASAILVAVVSLGRLSVFIFATPTAVRDARVELARISPPDPKSGAAANYANPA